MRTYHYCSGPEDDGLTCDRANLELVARLNDYSGPDLKQQEFIYRCRVCGGLYKYLHGERYQPRFMDSDEGWEVAEEYIKVENPLGSEDSGFSIEEARLYGYEGEDRPLSGGRCARPREPNGLTCRFSNLAEVARLDEVTWIRRCTKCGQFYKQIRERSVSRFHKPDEENGGRVAFTLAEAVRYGYKDPDGAQL